MDCDIKEKEEAKREAEQKKQKEAKERKERAKNAYKESPPKERTKPRHVSLSKDVF